MTVPKNSPDLFLEADEMQAVADWCERIERDAHGAFADLEQAVERIAKERVEIDAAYLDAVKGFHAAIDRTARRAERAVVQLPTPASVFLSDAERDGAYRATVAFLSDAEDCLLSLESSLDALLAVRRSISAAVSSLLDAYRSLDVACLATRQTGVQDVRLREWRGVLEAADAGYEDRAERLAWQSDRVSMLLRDVLPKFGRRVSKIADFAGRGAACNPREVRRELSELMAFLRGMKEERKK